MWVQSDVRRSVTYNSPGMTNQVDISLFNGGKKSFIFLLFQFDFLQDLCPVYYKGPEITAKAVASLYNEDHRDNINILDIAAGTGFVAEQVK